MKSTLTAKEIDEFVDAILKKDDPAKRRHDPVDDFATLCRFATFAMPGVRNLPGFVEVPPLPSLAGRHAQGRELIRFVGLYLEAINPTLSAFDWARLYHALLMRRNGRGVFVRIRKRPALAIRDDARRGLSFLQLQAKYPDHKRSILRRYHKEASDARRKR
jgi:hypothetical protein